MHILTEDFGPYVTAYSTLASAGALGYCLAKTRLALSTAVPESIVATTSRITTNISSRSNRIVSRLTENHMVKMAFFGLFIFFLHRFNFPVNNDVSGHLLGGVSATLVLGPFSGTLIMSLVLAIQTLLFNYGSINVIGLNILNMCFIGTLGSYYVYYFTHKMLKGSFGFYSGIILASVFSRVIIAIAYTVEMTVLFRTPISEAAHAVMPAYFRVALAAPFFSILIIQMIRSCKIELEGKVID